MAVEDRLVAGMRCSEVLARLSDYLDAELPGDERERVEAHLRGCDLCERFGGEVGGAVSALRSALGGDLGEAEVAAVQARLRRALP